MAEEKNIYDTLVIQDDGHIAETKHTPGPEERELKYCKEHRTIHCSCQQRTIDTLQHQRNMLRDACKAVLGTLNHTVKRLDFHEVSHYEIDGVILRLEATIAACKEDDNG